MLATVSYARKLSEQHSFGVGVMLIRQQLDIDGAGSIGLPKGRDESYGGVLRLGYLGKLTDELNLGLSYATRGYMGKMRHVENLLAEGGDMDMPPNYSIGLSYVKGDWALAADVQRILWSDVKSLGNPGLCRASGAPGDREDTGFGWRDQTVYRLGVAYQATQDLILRVGYNDASQLLDSRDGFLGMLAPAANHQHVTLGATYRLQGGNELSFAYVRSFKDKGGKQRYGCCEFAVHGPALAVLQLWRGVLRGIVCMIDPKAFRQALSHFAIGVTVVTTRDLSGPPIGVTASSFNSVSLEAPLLLWSIFRNAYSYPAFAEAEHFAVHVLGEHQQERSNRFGRASEDKFSGLACCEGIAELPLLDGCPVRFECSIEHRYQDGDHLILVGRVLRVTDAGNAAAPLLLHRGRYAGLETTPEV